MILNLGAGGRPIAERVNVDIHPGPGIDVVWDLDRQPWPFEDGAAAEIHALHVFEHVADPVGFMCEAHRVLITGGLLHIEVPHWEHRNAYTDPTHRRFCTEETFDYWVPETWLYAMGGPAYHRGIAYDRKSVVVVGADLIVDLTKAT